MKKILIITSSEDEHSFRITENMKKRKVYPVLFLTDQISYLSIENGNCFVLDKNTNVSINLCESDVIWFRRPKLPTVTQKFNSDVNQYLTIEYQQLLDTVYRLIPSNCRWFTHPDVLAKASNKLFQLHLAQLCGLKTPSTLITFDYEKASMFHNSNKNGTVIKTLKAQVVDGIENYHIFRACLVNRDNKIQNEMIQYPCVLQSCIVRKYEVRVVVIAGQIFSFGMQPPQNSPIDIKSTDLDSIKHFQTKLSDVTEAALLKMLKELNLQFCSADFIVDENGQEIFLELNPNGQWLWLEDMTNIDLINPFIDMLAL